MHELSIIGNILDIILEYARKNNAIKISSVNLKIGVMSDVMPEWAQDYFDMLSKGTMAENAELKITRIPAVIKCLECSATSELSAGEWNFTCSKCSSEKIQLLSGRELQVESIEIE